MCKLFFQLAEFFLRKGSFTPAVPVSPDTNKRGFVPEFVKFDRADLESRDYSRDYSTDMSDGSDDVIRSNDDGSGTGDLFENKKVDFKSFVADEFSVLEGSRSVDDIERSLAETKLDSHGKRFVQLQTPDTAAAAAAEKERHLAE